MEQATLATIQIWKGLLFTITLNVGPASQEVEILINLKRSNFKILKNNA